MISPRPVLIGLCFAAAGMLLICDPAEGRNPYRKAFFDVYPAAEDTQLGDLPSNAGHCGACHFDFDGGGQRNPYGLEVEVALGSGLFASDQDAIASLAGNDADNDGFSNAVEITETALFSNTPTFPGLAAGNLSAALNVTLSEVEPYLTPSGSTDTTPPTIVLNSPNGSETLAGAATTTVAWTADDASGISHVDLYISEDGGSTWMPVAVDLEDTGSYQWFVPNRPGPTLMRAEAHDNAGNEAADDSEPMPAENVDLLHRGKRIVDLDVKNEPGKLLDLVVGQHVRAS